LSEGNKRTAARAGEKQGTYEALRRLPENQVGEIIDGELITRPRPTGRHLLASSCLGHDLIGPFHRGDGGPGGWWILDEPELDLEGHTVVPDLAGWRRERLPRLPEGHRFFVAPDWVCEVLSPATARLDRTRKMSLYAAAAVSHLWLLDPALETLEVYALREQRWTLVQSHSGDETVRAPPFEAIALSLAGLWAR